MEGRFVIPIAPPTPVEQVAVVDPAEKLLANTKLPTNTAMMSMIIALEKEKMRLSDQIHRDAQVTQELEAHVKSLEEKLLAQRTKLSNYNALFMRLDDAENKAPRQRLGAREAVLGTKRIIQKELTKLENDVIVAEMKLNKSKEKNQIIKDRINTLRVEQVTYKKMFADMQAELGGLKSSLHHVDNAIKDIYFQRDKAQEEMRELTKQFVMDKREKQEDFAVLCDALETQQAELSLMQSTASVGSAKPHRAQSGKSTNSAKLSVGKGTPRDEEQLRKQVQRYQERIMQDKYEMEVARRRAAAYTAALDEVKAATGYSSCDEVIEIFNKYEDEKFTKAQQVQQLVDEIEKLERSVNDMHQEVYNREEENTRLKSTRAATIDALESVALQKETEAEEANAKAQKTLSEVKSLFTVIEYVFCCLGLKDAMDCNKPLADIRPSSASSDAFNASRSVSPTGDISGSESPRMGSRKPRASVLVTDRKVRHAVQGGVSGSTLAAFMGTIESTAAELIQQYAVFMAKFAEKAERGDIDMPFGLLGSIEDGDDDYPEVDEAAAEAARTLNARRTMRDLATDTSELTKRLLSPGTLGPANPPGKIREAIASSALMAALAVDSKKLMNTEDTLGDDDSRPLHTDELKLQAEHHFSNDKNISALKLAAHAAATVLVQSPRPSH